jgi:hypothetical protein
MRGAFLMKRMTMAFGCIRRYTLRMNLGQFYKGKAIGTVVVFVAIAAYFWFFKR